MYLSKRIIMQACPKTLDKLGGFEMEYSILFRNGQPGPIDPYYSRAYRSLRPPFVNEELELLPS